MFCCCCCCWKINRGLYDLGNHFAGKFDLILFFGIVPRPFPLYNEFIIVKLFPSNFYHFVSSFRILFIILYFLVVNMPTALIILTQTIFFFNKYKINK